MDDNSPKKKPKCLSLLSEGNQELGLCYFSENASLSGPFEKEKLDNVENKEGSFGVQEVGSQVNAFEVDLGFVLEVDKKAHLGSCLDFQGKRVIEGKGLYSENVMEVKKKRQFGELGVGKVWSAKTYTGNISGFATNSSNIDDDNNIGGIKGHDFLIRGSLKIEVIDDTALIGSFPLSEIGNGNVKDEKKGKQEIDGKKAKR
ncbi:hypothetical protein DITRI_Ditri15bG0038600 [Diplodiscus trichospermus]